MSGPTTAEQAAALVVRTATDRGLPERIEDPAALAAIAKLIARRASEDAA